MIQQKVKVIEVNEPWATAKLIDGAIVEIRPIFIEVFQCLNDDGTPQYSSDGTTIMYGVNHQIVISVTNPPVININDKTRKN